MPNVTPTGGIDMRLISTTATLAPSTAKAPSERAGTEAGGSTTDGDKVQISMEGRQKAAAIQDLTPEQKDQVTKLVRRDQEVRTHEQAHIMAGGTLVRGGASFSYQTGPDGKKYAVGGEVNIDTSPVDDDPKATISKAQQIQKAALAPASPSGQDRAVAAQAAVMQLNAQRELAQQSSTDSKTGTGGKTGTKLALSV
jgi:hypothetical protein